jgi:cell division protein FtsI/penicillin-binding protein 2
MIVKQRKRRNWRLSLFNFFAFSIFGTLVGRLIFLQILEHSYYSSLASKQHLAEITIEPLRGSIYFSDGKSLLAYNDGAFEVALSPRNIKDPQKVAQVLSKIITSKSYEEILKLAEDKNRAWIVIDKNLPLKYGKDLENLDGVYLQSTFKRSYPQGKVAANVVGFVGESEQGKSGKYGLEEYFEKYLKGKEGKVLALKDARGEIILPFVTEKERKVDGCDLITTLNFEIQLQAEKFLEEIQKKYSPKSSVIIIADPKTGEILAMASRPNFDPNFYFENKDYSVFLNRALIPIEPGSIFKAITLAGALEKGVIDPTTTYEDSGVVKVDPISPPIHNASFKKYGKRTMTEVLEYSINTGAVFAEQKLGKENFLYFVQKFGFGKNTGIELAGEKPGSLKNLLQPRSVYKEIEYATASFGQGILVTPIQVVQAFMTIANGGKLTSPKIVKSLICPGKEKVDFPPKIGENVISPETASKITAMLVSSVERGYTKKAKVEGYLIAGKTGTAQKPLPQGGYSDTQTWHTLVIFAPAFDPKFLIFSAMEEPNVIAYTESTLVPAIKPLEEYLFGYFKIPKSE